MYILIEFTTRPLMSCQVSLCEFHYESSVFVTWCTVNNNQSEISSFVYKNLLVMLYVVCYIVMLCRIGNKIKLNVFN